MAVPQAEPVNFPTFWSIYGKLVSRLMRERAHAEVALIIDNGNIKIVRVNRNFLPANLPEV